MNLYYSHSTSLVLKQEVGLGLIKPSVAYPGVSQLQQLWTRHQYAEMYLGQEHAYGANNLPMPVFNFFIKRIWCAFSF